MSETRSPGQVRALVGGALLVGAVGLVCYLALRPGDARVSGRVTLDGEPVPDARIVFRSEDENNRSFPTQSDEQGYYRLGPGRRGIPPGKYRVAVTKMTRPDGKSPSGERPPDAEESGLLQNTLPRAYGDVNSSPLQYDITGGANEVNLELKSKP
jgi:hypothetical protein